LKTRSTDTSRSSGGRSAIRRGSRRKPAGKSSMTASRLSYEGRDPLSPITWHPVPKWARLSGKIRMGDPTRPTLIFALLVQESNGDWKEVLLVLLVFCLSGNGVYAFGAGNIPRCAIDRSGCPVWSLADKAYSYGHLKGKAFRHGDIVGMLICALRVLSLAIGRSPWRLVQTSRCKGWDVWQSHRETQVFAYGYQEDLLRVGLVL